MYVKTHMFENLFPSSLPTSFSHRSIKGPKKIVGIGVAPQTHVLFGYNLACEGVLQFYDTNEAFDATSGDPLIQFPMKYSGAYSAATFFLLSDSDGYVQFENGITIDSTGASTETSPLSNCCANIFYI